MDTSIYPGSLNFNKICRTCLTENDDMELIFNDNNSDEFTFSYQAMLMSCTKLKISHGDGLPSKICLQCIAEVSQAFTFKTQSERAENILRTYSLGSDVLVDNSNEIDICCENETLVDNKDNIEEEQGENVNDANDKTIRENFTTRKLKCGFCPKRFKNRYELQRHQNIHLGVKFSCSACDRQFTQESSRNYHIRTVHGTNEKTEQSLMQKEEELQDDVAKVRYRIHFGGVTNDPKKCNFCSKRFRTKYELIRHMNIHLGVKFKCYRCDKRFTQASGRNVHMKNAHGIRNRKKTIITKSLSLDENVNASVENSTQESLAVIKLEDIKNEVDKECVIMTDIKEENYDPEFLLPLSESEQFESVEYLKDEVWVCDICTEGFDCKDQLLNHLENHRIDNRALTNINKPKIEFNCPKCSKSYHSQLSLNAHMKIHKNEQTMSFVCSFCNKSFRNQIDLNIHSKVHTTVETFEDINESEEIKDFDGLSETATFQCSLCPKLFKTTNALRGHVKVHKEHNHGTVFTCSRCNIGFPTQGLFIKHNMLFHSDSDLTTENNKKIVVEEYIVLNSDIEKFAYDNTCTDYQFLNDPDVNTGVTEFAPLEDSEDLISETFVVNINEDGSDTVDNLIMADVDTFQCDICLLCFETTDILLRHKIDAHLSETFTHSRSTFMFEDETKKLKTYDGSDKKFTCGVCGRGFTKHVYMKRHMMLHTGEKPYKCPESECTAAFSNSGMLISHKRKKHKTSSNSFLCSRCGDTFVSNDRLREHTKRHLNQRDFPCLYCEKKFFTKNTLRIHTRIHTNEKPYMCQFCGKGFAQMGDMQLHVRWHTGEKPYKCNYCDRRFTTTGNRRDHEVIHLEERNFKCSVCSKAFKAQRTLKMHFRQHTGERPYTCEVCNKSFRRQHHVRIHMKVHGIHVPPKPKNF